MTIEFFPTMPEPGAIEFIDEPTAGFTEDEAYAFLSGGTPYLDVIVAAADAQTGAMIAFIPSSDDLAELVLNEEGAEPLEQLHCTALYLGDADEYDDEMRATIHAAVEAFTAVQPVIRGDVFGYSVWGPDTPDACLVADVGGVDLEDAQNALVELGDDLEIGIPDQKVPYRPHVTLAYAEDPRTLMSDELMARTGPITFDVVRVAFGGVVTDYLLGAVTASGEFVFHLAGQHDQQAHGHKTTISPGDSKAFDRKMGKARTGDKAKKKIADSDDLRGKQVGYGSWDTTDAVLSESELHDYQISAFYLNDKLRHGGTPKATTYDSEGIGESYHGRAALEGLDTAMSSPKTRIKSDVVVERGIRDPHKVFGSDWNDGGGNEGLTWDDDGFVSTTLSSGVATHFSTTAHSDVFDGTPVHMRMYVPEGTHGVFVGRDTSLPDYAWENEVILDRGMRFRVMTDHGLDANGTHHIDVEVLGHPEGSPARVLPSAGFGWSHTMGGPSDDDFSVHTGFIAASYASYENEARTTPRFIDIGPQVRLHRFAVFVDEDGNEHAPDLENEAKITASAETVFTKPETVYNDIGSDDGGSVDQVTLAAAGPVVTGQDEYAAEMTAMNGTPWTGALALEAAETGDGRMFSANSLTWPDPAQTVIPLRRNVEDSHGGQPTTKAVLVGRITKIWRDAADPMKIMGSGVFDDNGVEGAEALRLVREKFLAGISIDPDSIKDADVELVFPESDGASQEDEMLMEMFAAPELTIFHAGRIRGATLVDIPAFIEGAIALGDVSEPALVADAAHYAQLSDRPWNGAAHEARLHGKLDIRAARTAFAHVQSGKGVDVSRVSTRFLHHEVSAEGAIGNANLAACTAGIAALNNGRATTLTAMEQQVAYEHMAQHLRAAGLTPPTFAGGQVILASSFDHLVKPPTAWFTDPKFSELTPLTITDDGQVFGHGAAWGTCHTAFGDACVTPPSEGDHMYYRLGEVVTAEGDRVAVGHITLGTGHAPVHGMTASRAAEHYDNTGTVVAVVASGEDSHGIWVAGAIRPGTPESRVAELRAASLSGDWRRIGGKLRLVAFLAVNRPGFPVPRTQTFVSNRNQLSLVAAGIVTQDVRRLTRMGSGADAALARIAKGIGRDPESRLIELRNRVKGQ